MLPEETEMDEFVVVTPTGFRTRLGHLSRNEPIFVEMVRGWGIGIDRMHDLGILKGETERADAYAIRPLTGEVTTVAERVMRVKETAERTEAERRRRLYGPVGFHREGS